MNSRQIVLFLVIYMLLLAEFALAKPAQSWGGAALSDWQNADKAVVISDMSKCTPRSALSPMKLKKGFWKVMPYELTNGQKGNMVWAAPEADAPELHLPLGLGGTAGLSSSAKRIAPRKTLLGKPAVPPSDTAGQASSATLQKGYYAIFVGLFSTSEAPTVAWLRLGDDAAPVRRVNRCTDYYGNTEEVFFKVAQLNPNSSLCISQQSTGTVSGCGVTHVKLVPLSAAEVARIEADRQDKTHRVLAATNDGFSDIFHRSPRTKAALLSAVEHFRDTDFGTLLLQSPGADKVNYPSQVGYLKGSHAEEYPRIGDRYFCESTKALAEQGINPMRTLIDGAHALGMKVHVGIRPAGWSFFEPYTDYWESPFYRDNPQWRCVDRDGAPVARMSWAVAEVRSHLIEVFREQIGFGADGANLVFNRGYPLVLYEEPARRLFEKRHGADPREIAEDDPRMVEFRAGIVETFLRELRAMLDEEGRRRGVGDRLAISVMVLGSANDDLRYGVDLGRLIGADLVDAVYTERGFGRTTNTYNLEQLRAACGPRGIPFSPGMTCVSRWYKDIPSYYDGGAAGIAIWDADCENIYEWTCVGRFGHREETRWRLENLDFDKPPRTILFFKRLGDQIRNGRFGPYWGG